jgi:hypothetical protein
MTRLRDGVRPGAAAVRERLERLAELEMGSTAMNGLHPTGCHDGRQNNVGSRPTPAHVQLNSV